MEEMTQAELDSRVQEQDQELTEMKDASPLKEDGGDPNEPKIFMRGNRVFMHAIFKLKVETMKKNLAWKPGLVQIEEVEHCHFFHDKDRKGLSQTRSTPTGGHFHDMITHDDNGKILVDENGFACPKTGPPRKYAMVRNERGKLKKKIVGIKFYSDAQDQYVVDDHIHEVEYRGSEELSPNKIKQIQQANQVGIAALVK